MADYKNTGAIVPHFTIVHSKGIRNLLANANLTNIWVQSHPLSAGRIKQNTSHGRQIQTWQKGLANYGSQLACSVFIANCLASIWNQTRKVGIQKQNYIT